MHVLILVSLKLENKFQFHFVQITNSLSNVKKQLLFKLITSYLDEHVFKYTHTHIYIINRHKYPTSSEDESSEESRPTPFHWELKTPQPTAFKRQRYPQLSQYRYPYASRNIQDIIKYLTNDADLPNRGIKFAGVYVNPKKYDLFPPGVGEMMSNSDRSEEDETSSYPLNEDPFYQYKPRHPTDVNLLATSNVRFVDEQSV